MRRILAAIYKQNRQRANGRTKKKYVIYDRNRVRRLRPRLILWFGTYITDVSTITDHAVIFTSDDLHVPRASRQSRKRQLNGRNRFSVCMYLFFFFSPA